VLLSEGEEVVDSGWWEAIKIIEGCLTYCMVL
jgi:hypothetical protein